MIVGTKIGRYEIRSKIGEGGMGEVYLGQDTKLEARIPLVRITSLAVLMRRLNSTGKTSRSIQADRVHT